MIVLYFLCYLTDSRIVHLQACGRLRQTLCFVYIICTALFRLLQAISLLKIHVALKLLNVQSFITLWDLRLSDCRALTGSFSCNYYDLGWLLGTCFRFPRPPLVRAFSFIQSLRHLHICPQITILGVTRVWLLTQNKYASYAVPVRQYRILQSRFLQCIPHGKPPCDLLMLRAQLVPLSNGNPAHKGFSPSGKKITHAQ